MKKIIIALLIVFALGVVAVAGVGYYLYRQARATVTQFAALAELPDIERGVRARGAYVPPSSEELTEAQVARLVRVQGAVRQRLGQRVAEFEAKYKVLADKDKPTLGDAPAMIAAYRDMVTMWLDAKRSQVDALNEAGLSMEEYRWIRDQAYRALGMAFVDLDLGRLADDISRGIASTETTQLRGAVAPAGPEANRKLIEGVKKQLEENLALASFGL